ncbi:MAG: HEAT repeat domain-containing protein [Cyanobacteria bacterium J06638_22]
MSQPDLEKIATRLQSPDVKERVLAMIELQKDSVPAPSALPLVKQALADRNVQIRGMAVFTLGIKPNPENLPLLVQVLETDGDHNMRAIAAGALGYQENRQALESLRHAFYEDTHWLVQFSAAIALGNLKDKQAQAVLLEALDSKNPLVQQAAIMALGEIGATAAIDRLVAFVDADDWMLRKHLAEALGNLPSPQSQRALMTLAHDAKAQVAEAANLSLQRVANPFSTPDSDSN